MGWRRVEFKGKRVWAAVGEDGSLLLDGGRVSIRYSKNQGAKIYRAGGSNVRLISDALVEDLPEGISADAAKSSRGSGFGSAKNRTAKQAAAAAEAARTLLAGLGPEVHVAYTDGSCRGNPGPAGAGALLRLADGRTAEASECLGRATNNVGELAAIALALRLLDEGAVAPEEPVMVLTDSSYSHGVLVKGWKAKANVELIQSVRDALARRPGVEIRWVAGHAGVDGNERADALANRGMEGETMVTWSDSGQ